MLKQILGALFSLSLFVSQALAQTPPIPLGPSGNGGGGGGGGGSGNVSGPASSTANDVATFSDTTGKVIQDGGKALPAGAVVGTTDTQTLTGKSIAGSEVNSGTVPLAQMPSVFSIPPYVTGHSIIYPNPLATAGGATSVVGVAFSYYCTIYPIGGTVTINALAARVATLSTGNSSFALQGAVFYDMVTTSGLHRPGTLIDYADGGGGFATGVATSVTSAMHNGTDAITIPGGGGPGIIWTCIQKFDAVAAFGTPNVPAPMIVGLIGTTTAGNALGTATQTAAVITTGAGFGGTNWASFTSSTTWVENTGASAPYMGLVVN